MSNETPKDDTTQSESAEEAGKPRVRARRLTTSIRAGVFLQSPDGESDGSGSDSGSVLNSDSGGYNSCNGGYSAETYGASGGSTWSCR